MEITFSGKRALVTGAGRGIGYEITKQLTKCGAQVIAVDISEHLLESLKEESSSIETVAIDLGDWAATKTALADIGDVDLLVNNAGVAILEPLVAVTEDYVNKVHGDPNCALAALASMCGLQDHTVYCATKGAVDAFTRAAALEVGPHNIRVNSVNPTVVMTELGRLCWSDPTIANPLKDKIPLQRFAEVEEVVNTVLYLLSDKASMITGTCLPVDGGYLAV